MFKPRTASIRVALIALITAGAMACGDDKPPTGPTPPISQQPVAISCPAPVTAQSSDGNGVTVTFNTPAGSNGQAPLTTTCTPASGTQFQVGTTSVSCTARDSSTPAQTASCSFNVQVQGPARLQYTNFMTYGDSITAGVISTAPLVLSLDLPGSYPSILQNLLRQRYTLQTMSVYNAGNPGELASDEGLRRFRPELLSRRPEVVLLMEGTNDLLNRQPGANAALAALDTMITEAESQNVKVCLATIPPQRGGSIPDRTIVAGLIPGFNDQIRALAARRHAVLIDVYAGMKDDLSLIGRDNLHPTALGYDVMAHIFADALGKAFAPGAPAPAYETLSGSALPASRTMRSSGASR
jgi:lysophospholipase L1-like esterase